MTLFRLSMAASWVMIMSLTLYVVSSYGVNWPAVYFGDLIAMNWRTQFNADFLVHLLLLCSWVYWREESKVKGAIYGFLSIIMGGMFGFAYLLYASYAAKGNVKAILLGSHYKGE